jgi:hypothetical protein
MRVGAVLALAFAAGFVTWLVLDRGGSAHEQSGERRVATSPSGVFRAKAIGPVGVSQAGLTRVARELGHPIYWAGPKSGYRYEVTAETDGRVYVRYLPRGVRVGDKRAAFLIVATYPYAGAFAALEKVGKKPVRLRGGGIAVVDRSYPESVYVAFPGVDYQVEVYDPAPRVSRRVALTGVRLVG